MGKESFSVVLMIYLISDNTFLNNQSILFILFDKFVSKIIVSVLLGFWIWLHGLFDCHLRYHFQNLIFLPSFMHIKVKFILWNLGLLLFILPFPILFHSTLPKQDLLPRMCNSCNFSLHIFQHNLYFLLVNIRCPKKNHVPNK